MAYVHCHACSWEQDDFWSWSYNPIKSLWFRIQWLARPRIVTTDDGNVPIFSWRLLFRECVVVLRRIPQQHWWTTKSWQKHVAREPPYCPDCGKLELDVD